ncbi:hypothetical protein HMPREF0548_0106, partial [Lactobacillus ultunensis DSM 16047]
KRFYLLQLLLSSYFKLKSTKVTYKIIIFIFYSFFVRYLNILK